MEDKLERKAEDWSPPLDPSLEAPLLPEVHTQSLFFRVASKRADYFSDVEAISQICDIEDIPTRHASNSWHAICDALTGPGITPLEEQPTWPLPIADRSTLVLPVVATMTGDVWVSRIPLARGVTCLYVFLRKCWLLLQSLQNTRKLPVVSPDW